MSGKFVTFEGPEGSGKTSVLKGIVSLLKENNKEYLLTREPGGNRISEEIRNIILDTRLVEMDARTEALLYAAARRQHLIESVLPALKQGKLVLCDRYVDSSVVYQGAGRGLGEEEVLQMNLFATEGLTPDFTFYFDLLPEIGLNRIKKHRQNEINRLDEESLDFHNTVHDAYLKLAHDNPERIIVIDASLPLSEVIKLTVNQMKIKLPDLFK
ncbi:dTMP kinase [Liquorilactobacillus mali]|uniref:Thymidylate kinase n=1 Tax=Liquorilactobacillus mali KCTC 3596 = DSM 20444 TaxID=1046596 RepID=A0A0R2E0N4_9LACO|nr:dTMP kinase [Liquorilactobacillus mali]KRN09874.1 thymidylate kinase [Liquorilactobacillus mali KCTC 3596 = DSM 20444]MDC7953281.1 dTMP kinase [Liquorilactobacillus mali]MDV7756674.1 dTMP kinase [Liquorilactobacillus mali]QFQ74165.1 dTMP kinase [Liquorilactobacillus mali]